MIDFTSCYIDQNVNGSERLTVSVDEGVDDVLVAVDGGEVESCVTL